MSEKNFYYINQTIDDFVLKLDIQSSYSLDRIIDLLDRIGDPQDNLKVIHIAGTSGKTSTSYYIAELLRQSGYKVGLTISPHINKANERVQIDLVPLDKQIFIAELNVFINILNQLNIKPTYFELFIAFAYWYFDKIKIDYAVVEVGLGGLLDATNVVNSPDKTCVITDIGFDHTDVLGNKLALIAEQKAGIIKNRNIVIMNSQQSEVVSVIQKICDEKSAKLTINNKFLKTKLPQILNRNFALACRTCEYVIKRDYKKPLSKQAIDKSSQLVIPGRLERIRINNKQIILDGAHNYQKIEGLIKSLLVELSGEKICVVLAIGQNKKQHLLKITDLIKQVADEIIISNFEQSQDFDQKSLTPDYLAEYFPNHKVIKTFNARKAVKEALKSDCETVLFTGSLYFISALKKIFN